METVYVGLGGNIGDAAATITKAALAIQALSFVTEFEISNYYLTSPVSQIPQEHYVNAVCRFKTTMNPVETFTQLEHISAVLGKVPKIKDAPRIIDLDLLFFGNRLINEDNLHVPHAQWNNRLFVLVPLLDLTKEIIVPTLQGLVKVNLKEYIQNFSNVHHETLVVLNKNFTKE